jgi:hypothetical protein
MQFKGLVFMRCDFNERTLKFSNDIPKDLAILDAGVKY